MIATALSFYLLGVFSIFQLAISLSTSESLDKPQSIFRKRDLTPQCRQYPPHDLDPAVIREEHCDYAISRFLLQHAFTEEFTFVDGPPRRDYEIQVPFLLRWNSCALKFDALSWTSNARTAKTSQIRFDAHWVVEQCVRKRRHGAGGWILTGNNANIKINVISPYRRPSLPLLQEAENVSSTTSSFSLNGLNKRAMHPQCNPSYRSSHPETISMDDCEQAIDTYVGLHPGPGFYTFIPHHSSTRGAERYGETEVPFTMRVGSCLMMVRLRPSSRPHEATMLNFRLDARRLNHECNRHYNARGGGGFIYTGLSLNVEIHFRWALYHQLEGPQNSTTPTTQVRQVLAGRTFTDMGIRAPTDSSSHNLHYKGDGNVSSVSVLPGIECVTGRRKPTSEIYSECRCALTNWVNARLPRDWFFATSKFHLSSFYVRLPSHASCGRCSVKLDWTDAGVYAKDTFYSALAVQNWGRSVLQQCVNVRQMYRGGRVAFANYDALRLSMMIDPPWSIAAPNNSATPRLEAARKEIRDLTPTGQSATSTNSSALSATGTPHCDHDGSRHPPEQLMDDCRTSFFGWTQKIRRYGASHSFRSARPLAPNEFKLPIVKSYRSCRWTLQFFSYAFYADEESNFDLELAGRRVWRTCMSPAALTWGGRVSLGQYGFMVLIMEATSLPHPSTIGIPGVEGQRWNRTDDRIEAVS